MIRADVRSFAICAFRIYRRLLIPDNPAACMVASVHKASADLAPPFIMAHWFPIIGGCPSSFPQHDCASSIFDHIYRAPSLLSINGAPVAGAHRYETRLFAFTVFNSSSILARRYSSDSRE
jgi:hypothetical protein